MNTVNLTIGQRVSKESVLNEYYIGTVKKIKGNKALVYFNTRHLSRWCNISNLEPTN